MTDDVGEKAQRPRPMRRDPSIPVEEMDLRGHGYAPGDYCSTCCDCDADFTPADKRAVRCLVCALKLEVARLESALSAARNAALEEAIAEIERELEGGLDDATEVQLVWLRGNIRALKDK